ncbi:MAG: EAL domain-containing protein [Hyphomicrobiaceae bacterium]|nr:EAL domain-containing protein [Hyphomicrobiaceae bacterium]
MHDRQFELASALEDFPGGISVLDPDLRIVYANREARAALELPETPGRGVALQDVLDALRVAHYDGHKDPATAVREHLDNATRRGRHKLRWRPERGSTVEVCTAPIAGGGFVTTFTDISSRARSEALLKGQADVLQLIAQGVPLAEVLDSLMHMIEGQVDGIRSSILLLEDGRRLRHGAAPSLPAEYCALIDGIEIGANVGSCGTAAFTARPVIVTDIATDPLWAAYKDIAAGFGLRSCWSTPIMSAKGEVLGTFAMYSETIRAPRRHEESVVEVATRIAGIAIERKRIEDRISFMATHDALTGLPNRSLLDEALQRAIDAARSAGRWMTVVFVDLDNFKLVNDSLGHAAGDELLKHAAQRMRSAVGDEGTVLRFGGDEFVIVLADQPPDDDALRAQVERIRREISAPIVVSGRSCTVTSSIGVATYPRDGEDAERLLTNADGAMYRSKQEGRDGLCFCTPDMRAPGHDEFALRADLRLALANGEFVLHYQPQIDVASGRIIGVEALLRWQHPSRGLLSPAAFIPAAEDTGLIVPIGDWVLKEACRQAMQWQQAGYAPLRMCVNVSARQFRSDSLVHSVAEALNGSGLASRHLELELTESLLMHDIEGAIESIKALQQLGVAVSIDDFGTGFSSLAALKTFPVSRLKIDKSFIAGLAQRTGKAVTSAVVSLGRALELSVVAEGVETPAQAEFLASIGCDIAQGFLYSQPMPPEAVAASLERTGEDTGRTLRGAA